MRKLKIFYVICITFSYLFCFTQNVNANASASISGGGSVNVGDTFTVTISVYDAKSWTYAVGFEGNVSLISGDTEPMGFEGNNTSNTLTFKATSAGTARVYANGQVSDGEKDSPISLSTNITITNPVSAPPTGGNSSNGGGGSSTTNQTPTNKDDTPTTTVKKSNDASLSELTISQGTLSPEFKPETTEYSVSLAKDVTTLSISAKANDAKASVSGTGEQTVKAGVNELSVTCTAEDGTTRTYIIKASVDETPTSFIPYNDKKLGVVRDTSSLSIPTGFEELKITLDGQEIVAWKNPLNNLIIVYMIDDANEKNFYLFDEKNNQITSAYKPMALLGRNIAVIDIPVELQTKNGLKFQEVEVDGVKLQGWVFEDSAFANYTLLYVMDEQGKMVYYLHEKSENTLQLYSNQAAISQDAYDTLLNDQEGALQQRMWVILALLITNVLTILLFVIWKMKHKKRPTSIHGNSSTMQREEPRIYEEPIALEDEINQEEVVEQPETEIDDEKSIKLTPYENEEDLFEEEK